ncbi:argininosuccinate lyase, partial [candidate division FCPU426 bacterium]|nr:argininosuccinate lyase [candidate division FCPU426 bacterium]
ERYSSSLEVDMRLLPYDVASSQAHVDMLRQQRIISRQEARIIQQGLQKILKEWEQGRMAVRADDEDVHMLVERRLRELAGPVAGKMHTARSRNDLVLTDLKLYLRDECEEIIRGLLRVQEALCRQARKHVDWAMPGYTHMQVAQPVLVSHWLLAHLEAFHRDEMRFRELLKGGLDELPLGAAALAGTSHPIDRHQTARWLGFSRVSSNSMDTVADRDFCLEFLSAAAICAVHFSRLAEELVWFSSSEFGFLTLDQGFSTGSSIMPQKRNPDIAELMRGRSGAVIGHLMALLTVCKGLPLTYNRDLQEDKEPVFRTADLLIQTCIVLPPMLLTLTFNRDNMLAACKRGFPTATDAADHLVGQGVPFREAHAAVGRAVTSAARENLALEDFSLERWRTFHSRFQPGIQQVVQVADSIRRKKSWGGTAGMRVRAAVQKASRRLFPAKSRNND